MLNGPTYVESASVSEILQIAHRPTELVKVRSGSRYKGRVHNGVTHYHSAGSTAMSRTTNGTVSRAR